MRVSGLVSMALALLCKLIPHDLGYMEHDMCMILSLLRWTDVERRQRGDAIPPQNLCIKMPPYSATKAKAISKIEVSTKRSC